MPQETALPLLAHSRNRCQLGSKVAQLATFAMIGHRKAMCFVANHLQQTKNERVRIEIDRFMFAAFNEQIRNLIVTQWWFDYSHHRHGFQIKFAHRISSRIELTLSPVDHNQIW